ncbi:MAG: phosphoribosylanthranilate isomerase [Planctomycetaceae bacterium]|nr:phosphoribosylanthranilate isomerase [Planctomycetaceae bacterium]
MWVKICGFTNLEDVQAVASEEFHAIGLNFYRQSPRYVSDERARQIAAGVNASVSKVGVFVDATPDEIRRIFNLVSLDYVQLHGDYSIDDAITLRDLPIIWVHRLGPDGLAELESELEQLAEAEVFPEACLIDARVKGSWGGSGQVVDWDRLATEYNFESWPRLILAGGLVPENVAQAIQKVHPWGVDVASGVEQDGKKSARLVHAFMEQIEQPKA